jgi:large subunit ribosomal protein L9e
MKTILRGQTVTVPEGVTLTVKTRIITVKGSRGTLVKDLRHLPLDMTLSEDGRSLRIERWFTSGKQPASIRSACSHIDNMIIGVTKGFLYKMRFVYAHFPINVTITNKDTKVEIRNFLGEKVVRVVDAIGDTTVKRSADVKDEIVLQGTDIQSVSRTAALVQQICAVKRKDIRKFLDGIYVSYKGNITE